MYLLLKLGSPCNTKPLCYIELFSKCENLDHSSQKNARIESKSILALLCIVMSVNTKVTGLKCIPLHYNNYYCNMGFYKSNMPCIPNSSVYVLKAYTLVVWMIRVSTAATYVCSKVAQLGRSTYMYM